jgi:Fic family protein
MEPIADALELKHTLDGLRPIDKDKEAVIMQKFRLDWNYHSNNLEGNSLTFGETKALILFGITAQGKPLKDHFEITGHNEAINWVTEIVKGDYPLTENFIRELHTLLLKSPYEVDAITPDGQPTKRRIAVGQYKTVPNHVKTRTGEIFRFATPEETPALMHDLLVWYRKKTEEADVNPIILAAEFHYRFIRIHPFDDGNGRTARILMNFILMRFGYPPVVIKTDDKINYFAALQQADAGLVKPFFDYIATNLIRSLEIMIAGAKGESIEESDDIDKEIALLEQRLKASKNKIDVKRTKEPVLEVYDNTIAKLWPQFITACQRFDNFYLKHDYWLTAQINGSNKIDALEVIRPFIDEHTAFVILSYEYTMFKQEGADTYNYTAQIRFDFELTKGYIVSMQNSDVKLIKNYGEPLTDGEFTEILRAEAKHHKEFIENILEK